MTTIFKVPEYKCIVTNQNKRSLIELGEPVDEYISINEIYDLLLNAGCYNVNHILLNL
mgnify:CR=1 FL=1